MGSQQTAVPLPEELAESHVPVVARSKPHKAPTDSPLNGATVGKVGHTDSRAGAQPQYLVGLGHTDGARSDPLLQTHSRPTTHLAPDSDQCPVRELRLRGWHEGLWTVVARTRVDE